MKTFTPNQNFTGYPGGVKTDFVAGQESAAYASDFVDLMEQKGLVNGKLKDVGTGAGKRPAKDEAADVMVAQTPE